jgi:hypothetical protein
MKIIPVIVIAFLFTGGVLSSCKHPVGPPTDTTKHKCDTCCDTCHKPCDTCHKPCDTCHKPCDTCNLNKDSLAHAFVWTEYINKMPGETNPTGVWVFGQNDIYIVGNSLWHYDGISFTIAPANDRTHNNVTMNGALNGCNIFAFSKTDFWMVHGGLAYHTMDGKYFDYLLPGGPTGTANMCWGVNSNDMFFVGNGGIMYHYDGLQFVQMNSNTTKDLTSVWGTSSSNVWACGFNSSTGETVILHYDGASWSIDNLSNDPVAKSNGFDVVWACDSSNVYPFVATSGSNVYRKTDNGAWRNDGSLIPNALGGNTFVGLYLLRGNSPNDIMAAGGWGWVGHWNGKTWKKYDALYDYNNSDYIPNALSLNGNTACVVGIKSGGCWVAIGQRKQ